MGLTGREPRRDRNSARRTVMMSMLAMTLTACNPTINLYGVYAPGWLVAGAAGFVLSYLSVGVLARFGSSRPLADSGLFFCSLGTILAYFVWLGFFSRY
jgi:hypothetical protein